jgi:hypothetical protein
LEDDHDLIVFTLIASFVDNISTELLFWNFRFHWNYIQFQRIPGFAEKS